jgi:hypothetical protein
VADTRAEPLFAAVAAVQRLLVVAASRSRLRARCHGFANSNRDVRFGSRLCENATDDMIPL